LNKAYINQMNKTRDMCWRSASSRNSSSCRQQALTYWFGRQDGNNIASWSTRLLIVGFIRRR